MHGASLWIWWRFKIEQANDLQQAQGAESIHIPCVLGRLGVYGHLGLS